MTQGKKASPPPPAIEVRPHPEGWQAIREGAKKASAVAETKVEAVARGREIARNDGAELVIKGKDEKIQSKDSHGRDPRRIKG